MNDPSAGNEVVRLRQLIDSVVEGTAAPDELRELDALLQSSADHRRVYRRAMGIHAELNWLHRADGEADRSTIAGEGILPAPVDMPAAEHPLLGDAGPLATLGGILLPIWRLANRIGTIRLAAAAVIFGLAAALGGAWLYQSLQPQGAIQISSITVAELQSDHQCEWVGLQSPLAIGGRLASGQRLELAKGTAKLLFDRGATVVVESPTIFELLTPTSIHLERGTVAVRVEGPEKEFIVASPDASIVDLGTSFGVHRGEKGATEVEVFEGAVEVYPDGKTKNSKVLGIGASAQVQHGNNRPQVDMVASAVDRFGGLLEFLWEDMSKDAGDEANSDENPMIVADFADGPVPGAVDTFYGAKRGRGWKTPWVAAGNPIGEIVDHETLAGEGNPYLRLRFGQAFERVVARQYGKRAGLDPSKPHVISWQWRFDGNIEQFGSHFRDRVYFYGNPFFRRNTWPTNTWLIGVVGGDDKQPWSKSKLSTRKVFPKRWFAFDRQNGKLGEEFDSRNMVDSGMELKAGVVYRFAVVVYPEEMKYDVAIRDNEQTFMRTGLSFRNLSGEGGQVVHFGAASENNINDYRFSLDSVHIEPLKENWLPKNFSQSRAPGSPSVDESSSTSDPES
jgi:hypothetical protein